ncbi:MAG: dihydrofolate reductase [Duncaniella sp.]|nr:dihydrofolate reductase [Duncaniella sp.]
MKPTVNIIAAVTLDLAIGDRGDLLYHISEDLRRFRSLTMGHPIVMGRNTFESFPKGALPGRRNIIVTRNPSYSAPGAETAPSLAEALKLAATPAEGIDASQIFVIGGGQIYGQALPLADNLMLTLIDARRPEADTRFPHVELPADAPMDHTDPATGTAYCFLTLPVK